MKLITALTMAHLSVIQSRKEKYIVERSNYHVISIDCIIHFIFVRL